MTNIYSVVTDTKAEYHVLAKDINEVPDKFRAFVSSCSAKWTNEEERILNIALEAAEEETRSNIVHRLIV